MSIDLVSWLIILTTFSLYGVLSGVELGMAVLRVEPRLGPVKQLRTLLTPRLEVVNLLLALGIVGMAVLFEDAAGAILRATWPVLAVGFLALVVRAGLLFYLFMHASATGGKMLNYLFAVVSFIVPISLGSAGIYMVTGQPFWRTGEGAALFVCLLVGLLALSAGFLHYLGGKNAPQGLVFITRSLNVTLAAMLAIVLLVVLREGGSHLLNLSYAYLAIMSAGIVLMQSVFVGAGKEWHMWWCLAVLAMVAPFLIGLANYPYLIFPDVMLESVVAI